MAKYFSVKKNTNKTLTVSKTDYTTYTEIINISADTVKNITLQPAFTPETVTFNYTGAVQTFTVPQGCTKLIVDCVGAAGHELYPNASQEATRYNPLMGRGGRVQCKLSVTPNQTLYIYVGGNTHYKTDSGEGGWNGGGNAGSSINGAGGGGASDIRTVQASANSWYNTSHSSWATDSSLLSRLVVAGGAGGYFLLTQYGTDQVTIAYAGHGGGLVGGDSTPVTIRSTGEIRYSSVGAGGGTQSAGGAAGSAATNPNFAEAGDFGIGGNGSYGGGGGGWYGGGGGPALYGAGGSSYTHPTLCTDVVHTQGYSEATGAGWITITTSNT